MLKRNMYYRHKAANMYRSGSILVAYTIAELPFIVISSLTFSGKDVSCGFVALVFPL